VYRRASRARLPANRSHLGRAASTGPDHETNPSAAWSRVRRPSLWSACPRTTAWWSDAMSTTCVLPARCVCPSA